MDGPRKNYSDTPHFSPSTFASPPRPDRALGTCNLSLIVIQKCENIICVLQICVQLYQAGLHPRPGLGSRDPDSYFLQDLGFPGPKTGYRRGKLFTELFLTAIAPMNWGVDSLQIAAIPGQNGPINKFLWRNFVLGSGSRDPNSWSRVSRPKLVSLWGLGCNPVPGVSALDANIRRYDSRH